MFNLEAFHRGVVKGRELIGGEEHHYSLMCHGLAEAMCAAGHEVTGRDMAARWHDPLSSANAEDLVDPSVKQSTRHMPMIGWVVACAEGMAKAALDPDKGTFEVRALRERRQYTNLGTWRLDKLATAAGYCLDEQAIDKEAEILFDGEYKQTFPTKRRGTKHYKALLEEKRDLARQLVRKRYVRDAEQELRHVKAWIEDGSERGGGHLHARHALLRVVEGRRTVAADVEALVGPVQCVLDLRASALEIEELWREHDEYVRSSAAASEAKIAQAKAMLPAKEDAHV